MVQAAVIAKRAAGSSRRKIAKDLGIHRNTVRKILDSAEVSHFLDGAKKEILQGAKRIARVYLDTCATGKEKHERARDFCERLEIIPQKKPDASAGGNPNVFIGIGNLPRLDASKPVLKELEATGSVESPVR